MTHGTMKLGATALGTMGLVGALTAGTALAAPSGAETAKAHRWSLSVQGGRADGAYTISGRGFTSTLNLYKTARNGKYLVFWHRQASRSGVWGRPGVNYTKSNSPYRATFSAPETGRLQARLCWADRVIVHPNNTVTFRNLKCGELHTWRLVR
ncbi:hypothetical protein DZF91_05495 [Actinomadura logoneensis]|uniref:Uncharacterized protein n=2 Tax=Actinomadura logoneensis TaxID=2293572 RepID=A0A372JS45_9ACTN|nr:hypothetical protein DZF91_05495 [Actinomadura logoneensis]